MRKTIPVHFFKEGVRFRLMHQLELKKWIASVFRENKSTIVNINYIFCSDRFLLKMNRDFLGHNYFTDIITFDNSEAPGKVSADIYISKDRVLANAKRFNNTFNNELHRVMVHGALHLIGYADKSSKDVTSMRRAEDFWLEKRTFKSNSKR